MLLYIFCPNECLFRVSSKRAGRVIRCPKCKMAIRIPEISTSDAMIGQPVPCYARVARKKSIAENESFLDGDAVQALDPNFTEPESEPRLPLPGFTKPVIRKRCNIGATEFDDLDIDGLAWSGSGSSSLDMIAPAKVATRLIEPPVPKQTVNGTITKNDSTANEHVNPMPSVAKPKHYPNANRLQEQSESRQHHLGFWRPLFALAISLVAVFNLIPALGYGFRWVASGTDLTWTNWMGVQVLVGGLQLVFVYFWLSKLRPQAFRFVAPVMLLAAFGFGLITAQFLLAGSASRLADVLEVSRATIGAATLGSVLNLCATTLACYFCFNETVLSNDQRASAQISSRQHVEA